MELYMNELNIDEITKSVMEENNIPSIRLQKYYSYDCFIRSLESNKFTFQKPSTWEDPFEDFISKLVNNRKPSGIKSISITNDVYAMSTINKMSECNGMWENFAKKDGVLINTTSNRIIKSIIEYLININSFKDKRVYENIYDITKTLAGFIKLNKVEYLNDKQIAEFFIKSTDLPMNNYNEFMFEALSKKRIEYEYENEYRIFIIPSIFKIKETKYLEIGYFKKTLTGVFLSPHINTTEYQKLSLKLINTHNIDKRIIEKSKLYDFEDFKKEYGL